MNKHVTIFIWKQFFFVFFIQPGQISVNRFYQIIILAILSEILCSVQKLYFYIGYISTLFQLQLFDFCSIDWFRLQNPLQLAHSGYQDTKIFWTKVWAGSLDFDLSLVLPVTCTYLFLKVQPSDKLKKNPNDFSDSSNKAFWDAERNAKNDIPLHSTVLEKIRKNCLKIVKNVFFGKNGQFMAAFLYFFLYGAL